MGGRISNWPIDTAAPPWHHSGTLGETRKPILLHPRSAQYERARKSKFLSVYAIPSELRDFPLALVGEAIGQLAAWAAMAAVDFGQRPVAGLAGSIELLHEPRAGQVLELAADLEQVDAESVEYRGTAHVDGTPRDAPQGLCRPDDATGRV